MKWLRSNSSLAMATGLTQQGLALVQFMLIARVLSPDALGQWVVFLALAGLIEMGRQGLVHNSIVFFSAGQPAERGAVRGAILVWAIGLTLFAGLLLVALGPWFSGIWHMPALPSLFGVYLITAPVAALLRYAESIAVAEARFHVPLASSLLAGAVLPVLLAVCYLAEIQPTPATLAWWQGAGWALALGYAGWKHPHTFGGLRWRRHWLAKVWGYGRHSLLSGLASIVMQRADVFLLGLYVSSAELAVYNVAARAVAFLDFPLHALGQVAFPRLSAAFHREGPAATARLYERSVGALLAVTLPLSVGVALLAPWMVRLLGGPDYLAAAPVLQLLAVGGMIKPWGRVFGITLDAIGRADLNLRMLVLSFVLNLGLNALLTPLLGITGTALAVVLSAMVGIGTGQWVLSRLLPANPIGAFDYFWPAYRQLWQKISTS